MYIVQETRAEPCGFIVQDHGIHAVVQYIIYGVHNYICIYTLYSRNYGVQLLRGSIIVKILEFVWHISASFWSGSKKQNKSFLDSAFILKNIKMWMDEQKITNVFSS